MRAPQCLGVHLIGRLLHADQCAHNLRLNLECQIQEVSCVEGGMSKDATAHSLPVLTTANASFVTPYLAVGGDLSYDDETALRQSVELIVDGGITHILDVRQEA